MSKFMFAGDSIAEMKPEPEHDHKVFMSLSQHAFKKAFD